MTDADAAQRTTVAAFYSHADGVGRSCMVANISLILASQSYRVLVIDLDLTAPSLYRFLTAFLPDAPDARPATSPVRLTCNFVDPRGSVDFIGPTTDTAADPTEFTVQRADLIERGYNFVLVDTPAGGESVALTAELADILVLGYSLNKQVMDKAAQHAQAIQGADRADKIRVLPVPMRVDQNAGGVTAKMRVVGRRQFAWLLADLTEEQRQQYWDGIEIPYEPDYAIEEALPFLDDSSDQRIRLVNAYVRLAAQLAPGPVPAAQPAVTDQTRARYRTARLAAADGSTAVTVLHAAANRYWAEWLVSELQRMDLAVRRRRIDQADPADIRAGSELIVVSEQLLVLPGASDYLSAVASPSSPGSQVQLGVSIDGSRLPSSRFRTLGYVDLEGKSAKEAREELASYYQVAGPSLSAPGQLNYPGRKGGPVSNLPVRDGPCQGRDDAIDRIRDHFTSRTGQAPLTLTGPPGIGKSRLALEYAYRFAAHYDLVVCIPSDSVHAIRAGLAKLAKLAPPDHPGGDAGLAALGQLQAESPVGKRWLLIYEGVAVATDLDGLLPEPGHGHVLLTARAAVTGSSSQLAVEVLAPDDASAMLVEQIPGLSPAEAAPIASALNGVPLALRLAAGWLTGAMEHLLNGGAKQDTITSDAAQGLGAWLADAADGGSLADPTQVILNLLMELLESSERGAAAILLLETCAFLAPSGLSRRLLRSPGMLAQLTEADSDIADPVVVHNVLRTLISYGFSLHRDTAQTPLQIHPRVMELVRDRMSPERQAERAGAVTRMLAASAPLDIDDDIGHAEVYEEVLPHVEPSGALLETDPVVRRWLANQVRFLWQIETVSAWKTAADLGERLARHWAATAPDKDDDTLLLRLRTQLANVYRSLCEFERAYVIDRDVLLRQRRVLGPRHLRTLMTARSYGADLRLVGDFEKALVEDQSTWQGFTQALGRDHLMTIVASGNLALSELMYGDTEQALERQQADIDRSVRIKSERPWQEPWMQFHVGTLLRELGRYEESRDRLREAQVGFADLVAKGIMAPTVWVVLRTDAGLAITKRRLGEPSLKETERTLEECRNTYGEDYPDVLALVLSRAGDLYATGRHDEAVEEAERARAGYSRVFGAGHPFTRLCEVDLSIYALAARQTATADEMSERALSSLQKDLVSGHLWSLAASVARANVLAVTDRLEEARSLEQQTLAQYRERLGTANPLTKIAAINTAVTRMLLNEPGTVPDNEGGMKRRRAIELDTPPY